jgi:two-component system chemotaxis response regulator CheY
VSVNFGALKIVIIEDEDFIRVLIRRLLHQLGVELIYEAKEGGEGLKEVVAHAPRHRVLRHPYGSRWMDSHF